MKEKLIEVQMEADQCIAGDFSCPVLVFDRKNRQKISNYIGDLNHPIEKLDLIYIYSMLHSTTVKHIFFFKCT